MSFEDELDMAYLSDEEFYEGLIPEVDDILERWLRGEDVSDFEDDGSTTLVKESADELE